MAESSRTAKTILKYEVDKASQSQVIASTSAVEGGLKNIGTVASNALKRLRDEFASGRREIERERQSLEAFEQDLRRIDRLEVRPTISVEQTSGRGRAELTDRTGSALSQIAGGLGSGELANAAGLVADLAGSVEDLGLKSTLTLGAIGLLGAGLTALVGVVQKMVEEAQNEYEARVGVIKAIQDQTSEEANQAQAQAAIQRENAQIALDYLEEQKAQQVALANSAGFNFEQFSSAIIKIEALNNLIREQELIVEDANATIGIYNELLAEGATKANDTAAAAANAIAMIERAQGVIAEGEARLAEIRIESIERFVSQATDLFQQLSGGFVGAVSQIPNHIERYTALADSAAAAQAAYNATLAQGQDTVTRLTSESQARQNTILQDGYDQAAELAEQYGIDRARAERDLQRELARINGQIFDATAERDALAAFQLNKQKEQEEQAAEDRADDRDADYKRELRQLADQTDKKLRAERDALQRSLDQAEAAWRAQLETRRQALEAEQAALTAFVNNTVNGMSIVEAATVAYTDFMNARAVDATNLLDTLAQVAIDRMQAIYDADQNASVGAGSGTVGYTPTAYASGGHARAGTLGRVNDGGGMESGYDYQRRELRLFSRPTRVLNAQQTAALMAAASGRAGAGQAANININLDGRTVRAASRREAARYVGELLGSQGIE